MNVLLDTHVLVWWEAKQTKFTPEVVQIITDPANRILVSDISFWEIVIKGLAGKPMIRGSIHGLMIRQAANGLIPLPIKIDHILGIDLLPMIHRDPFDRLLIAQAIAEPTTLISADGVFSRYPVTVVW